MVKVRRWSAYRAMERPYTRVSKFRTKNYTRGNPQTGITQFVMGNIKKTYSSRIELSAENNVQIRSQALEAARQACNRRLDKVCGKENYKMQLVRYPYHIYRENPLASGAGADRMSTGMQKAFGKTVGRALQIHIGECIVRVEVDKQYIKTAKEALRVAGHRLPMTCSIKVVKE